MFKAICPITFPDYNPGNGQERKDSSRDEKSPCETITHVSIVAAKGGKQSGQNERPYSLKISQNSNCTPNVLYQLAHQDRLSRLRVGCGVHKIVLPTPFSAAPAASTGNCAPATPNPLVPPPGGRDILVCGKSQIAGKSPSQDKKRSPINVLHLQLCNRFSNSVVFCTIISDNVKTTRESGKK